MFLKSVGKQNYRFDKLPNECPQCHHAIDPRHLEDVVCKSQAMGEALIDSVFQCPQAEFRRVFIGRYAGRYHRNANTHHLELISLAPFSPKPPEHSDEVSKVSPQFVTIFREAAAAEGWRLKEIAGCGYRKALEFLVKDYCVMQEPASEESIKAKFLGQVIEDHITDASIKACAKRAAWLGNDETHYVRRWTDLDLTDLKRLIALTESWITTALRTKQYLDEMFNKPMKLSAPVVDKEVIEW